MSEWVNQFVFWINSLATPNTMLALDYVVRGLIAIVLVSLVSGAVGSLVVSNRMAFFSDALAHCALSGVALGVLIAFVAESHPDDFGHWITLIMVVWGIVVGVLIAFVQEKSLLPSDTVIGVFFAGALGLGAIFSKSLGRRIMTLEALMFGNPMNVTAEHIVWLIGLLLLTGLFLAFCYNALLFGSFNPSLANSRRVPARLARYLFIVLLAIIVNLCQQTVGILLINGLLIVPGATASYLSRNLRQLLWWSVGISLFCGIAGMWLSWEIVNRQIVVNERPLDVGISGMVLVLSVLCFGLCMVVRPLIRGRA